MKRLFTLVFSFCTVFAFSQTCPETARVSNGASHQLYLEYSDNTSATTLRDALQAGALQTAIFIDGNINEGAANEEAISDQDLSKPETTVPSGNLQRIRSTIPVTVTNNGQFTGTISINLVSTMSDFSCVYSDGILTATLPIALTELSAKAEKNSVMISWQTASEENNDYMAVERSINGRDFVEIGKVSGAGTTTETNNYMLEDTNPIAGTNYYRLRQVDYNGNFEYSYVVEATLRLDSKPDVLMAYPTLVTNDTPVTIDLSNVNRPEGQNIEVINLNGQLLQRVRINDNSTVEIATTGLNNGMYLLRINDAQQMYSNRIIVNK